MPHTLPGDPRAPVIQWRTSGGLGASDTDAYDLVVRADGSVTVAGRFGGGSVTTARLSPERLQALLDEIIDRHRFFEFDPSRLGATVEAAGQPTGESDEPTIAIPARPPYVDAGDTLIVINADGHRQEARWHGLAAAARAHPDIAELQDLRAVEERLVELAMAVASGGA